MRKQISFLDEIAAAPRVDMRGWAQDIKQLELPVGATIMSAFLGASAQYMLGDQTNAKRLGALVREKIGARLGPPQDRRPLRFSHELNTWQVGKRDPETGVMTFKRVSVELARAYAATGQFKVVTR